MKKILIIIALSAFAFSCSADKKADDLPLDAPVVADEDAPVDKDAPVEVDKDAPVVDKDAPVDAPAEVDEDAPAEVVPEG